MTTTFRLLTVSFIATISLLVVLSPIPGVVAAEADDSRAGMKADEADIAKWRQLKFGLFIHWGPVSLQGTEIGWSRGGERRGCGGSARVCRRIGPHRAMIGN